MKDTQEINRLEGALKIISGLKEENKLNTSHLKRKEPKKWMDGAMIDMAYAEAITTIKEKLSTK